MNTFDITQRNGDIHTVMVDDEDYDEVMKHKWSVTVNSNTTYVYRTISTNRYRNGKRIRTSVLLHRFLLGITGPKIEADHRDHNGLNNQRYNLREVTHQQNMFNRKKASRMNGQSFSSNYKGVHWHNQNKKWIAKIMINTKTIHLGCFTDEYEAYLVYEEAAKKIQGEYKCKGD